MNVRCWATTARISSTLALGWTIVVIAGLPVRTQAQFDPPSSGLTNPRAIVFNSGTGKVYAVDTGHSAVQIYSDATKQMHRVTVGAEPVSIAVNTANGRAYIANAGDGTVTVIDGGSDAVVATVPVGSHPYSVAVNSATGKVYITHTFGDQLSIVDGTDNNATDLKTGSTDLIAINSRAGTIYLLGYGGAVKVLDGASQEFNELPIGKHGWALTTNDVTGDIYVARIESADLAVIKPDSSNLTILSAGEIPCAIAVNSEANQLFVANYGDNSVSVIDGATGRKTATVRVGRHPKAIAFDANRNLVYVANTSDGTVTVIDAANNSAVATLAAGRNPYALAEVPGSSRLYVANETNDNPSTVVDLAGLHKLRP